MIKSGEEKTKIHARKDGGISSNLTTRERQVKLVKSRFKKNKRKKRGKRKRKKKKKRDAMSTRPVELLAKGVMDTGN